MTKVNIVIIDDHQLFREGVKRILDFEPTFEVVAEGDDGDEAARIVEHYHPDVVIMDINMPNVNGVEATKQLVELYPESKVIILSIHDDENYVKNRCKRLSPERDGRRYFNRSSESGSRGRFLPSPESNPQSCQRIPPSCDKRSFCSSSA